MTLRKRLASPWLTLLCIALGGVAGVYAPVLGDIGFALGGLYLAVVTMVALPLEVVAGFFGLRQIAALPRPMLRLAMMAALALALLLAAALLATLWASAVRPGAALSAEAQAHLGALVNSAQHESMRLSPDADPLRGGGATAASPDMLASVATLALANGDRASNGVVASGGDELAHTADTPLQAARLSDVVPDNFYRSLATGHLWGILTGTVFFGLAFARLSRQQSQSLGQMLEGAYRTFEIIIDRANLCIPILAFGMTAHLSGQLNAVTLGALGGLIGTFLCVVGILCGVALLVIARLGRHTVRTVLDALQTPVLISLTSGSAIAPVPNAIEALSAHLGYSRAVAELLIPFGSVFVRVGNAVYYACVALFVTALYHYPLGPTVLLLIWLGAALAAFLSSSFGSAASIGYIGFVLSFLELPADAVVVLLVSIDPLCAGPRNVLSLLSVCALVALASAGLPTERSLVAHQPGHAGGNVMAIPVAQRSVAFAFTRVQFALALACAALLAAFVLLIGVGVGAR